MCVIINNEEGVYLRHTLKWGHYVATNRLSRRDKAPEEQRRYYHVLYFCKDAIGIIRFRKEWSKNGCRVAATLVNKVIPAR